MEKNSFIEINRDGWNNLIKGNKPFSNTILPEYGPMLKRNEDNIGLMKDIKGKKVLDLGCGAGESLEYLYRKGASEIWGIDISSLQIEKAKKRFLNFKDHFIIMPMEELANVPKNYFDYIISIFSIGYTSDIQETFNNVYKYLNNDGSFIVSWTHPFYYCLDIKNDNVIINKSYFDEDSEVIKKGPDKINLVQNNLMISTIINAAKNSGLYVDTMLEEQTVVKDDINGYVSNFWRKEKVINCPSTIIFKFKKL